ncbi:PREDICTED: uncharacterized protein LOC108569419 [Nicrophorus vespilloides]|uniref:Uncharacterized protein LOC108569419 n=1 Tax=Nicrophorus vespilloides TaxID=110193 RepID=A0ABM1NI03_NICVS|nr:PREDICTED: uncharacterized protein LOC108569419 [Nicrophorus vespilloides]
MRTLPLIVVLFVTSFVNANKIIYAKKDVERIAEVASICTKSVHVDPKYSLDLDDIRDFPSRKEIKCLSLCMIELFGLLSKEHRFLPEAYLSYMDDPIIIQEAKASMDKCLPQYDIIDSCEDAYDLHQCILKNF